MDLIEELSHSLVRQHPERVALALEHEDAVVGAAYVGGLAADDAAAVLRFLTSTSVSNLYAAIDAETLSTIVAALPTHTAARQLRSLDAARLDEVLGHIAPEHAQPIASLMKFPERSAGGLMDPRVLELRDNLKVAAALERVRLNPDRTRYNVYVVDAEHKLVGAINLRELLLAADGERIADMMVRNPHKVLASAGVSDVVQHPGWRVVHALPVVDENGVYLGAIRFRTLRRLEADLYGGIGQDADAVESLGRLFGTGAAALWYAMSPENAHTTERDS